MTETPATAQSDTLLSAQLWAFALRCYAVEKEALLAFQETADLHINDALFLAFSVEKNRIPDPVRWGQVREGRPRRLLLRMRRYRQQMRRSHPGRSLALDWELALERWDLERLATCLAARPVPKYGAGLKRSEEVSGAAVASLGEQSALGDAEARDLINRLVRGGQEG
jgi:hypothetical protein